MKRLITSFSFGLFFVLAMSFSPKSDAQPRVGVSINFQTFYDQLSPYGEWIDYPDYGYTWRPRMGSDFRPYSTGGHWMYTDDESWMWASDYDWGWAPFHYGRWFQDPYYGWLWVPGYDWSPAWVAWRGGGDYYGWAPLRPGISINIGFGNYNPPYDYWTFAPGRYMNSRYINRYYYPYRNNVTIINHTTIINNYGGRRGGRGYYTNGPRRADVERYTGRIQSVRVSDASRPGRSSVGRNSVSVYRPAVQRESGSSRLAPRNAQQYDRSTARTTRSERVRNTNSGTNRSSDNIRSRSENSRSATDRQNSQRADQIRQRQQQDATNTDAQRRSADVERQQQETRSRAIQRSRESSQQADQARQRQEVQQRQQDIRSRESTQRNEQIRQRQEVQQRQQQEISNRQAQQRSQENAQRSEQVRQRAEVQRQSAPSRDVQIQRSPSSGGRSDAGRMSSGGGSRGERGRGR